MGNKGPFKVKGLKMKLLSLLLSIICLQVFALEVKQNRDDISMAVSITDSIVEIQMEAPMNLLLGFTKHPDTKVEKTKWSKLQGLWFSKRNELFSIEGYKCLEEEVSIEYEIEEELEYGEILAKVVLKCNKTITKANMTFKIKNVYQNINNIKLTVFPNENKTKAYIIKNKIEKLSL